MFKKMRSKSSEPLHPAGEADAGQKQMRFAEEGVMTHYARAFNMGMGDEEMIFIFGNPTMEANAIQIETKVAVSPKTAKRIALTLINLLQQYEEIHGELDVSIPQKPNVNAPAGIM